MTEHLDLRKSAARAVAQHRARMARLEPSDPAYREAAAKLARLGQDAAPEPAGEVTTRIVEDGAEEHREEREARKVAGRAGRVEDQSPVAPELNPGYEITPEMIEAGLEALDGELLDGHCSSRPELVRAVYRAMVNRSGRGQSRR